MKNYCLILLAICTSTLSMSQMTATFDKDVNTICDGSDCEYTGPSIMINEIMVSPSNNDGSLSGNDSSQRGEWIELYNPNLCEPIDISCYYLGSAAAQGGIFASPEGEGFQLPSGTVVPAGGFCIVRGVNAENVPSNLLLANGGKTVEIVVPGNLSGDGICIDSSNPSRLWFPNSGGWFAFYDNNGVVQDAISWGSQSGRGISPCIAEHSTCGSSSVSSLSSYDDIPANRKEKIYNSAVPNSWGSTVRRIPDGGVWQVGQNGSHGGTPTQGDCNDECEETASSTCDGEATINVSDGSGDYTYSWDDSEGQLTQTATGLCAGTYTVTVTDQVSNEVQTFTVEVEDFVPSVDFSIEDELCNYGQTILIDDVSTYSPQSGPGGTGSFSGTGVSGSDFDVSVSGEGDFPITYDYTDTNGCTNSADAEMIVNEVPQAQISGIASEYCMADSIVDPTLSPAGGTLSGPGVSNNQFIINDAGEGTHTIKYVVENQHGCKDSTEFSVTINALPIFTLDITSPNCSQSDGAIVINPTAGDAPYNYSIDEGNTSQNDNTFSDLPAGPYGIVVTDDNGCISAMDTTLSTDGAEDPSFTFEDFCEGESNGPTNVNSTNGVFSFTPPASDGATIDSLTGVISDGVGGTTYTVRYITMGVCGDTADVSVTVHSMPDVSFTVDTTMGIPPLTINYTNTSSGADTYSWNFGDGSTEQNNSTNVSHVFNNEGVFNTILTGETNNGMCTDTASIKIIAAYPEIDYKFPNVFTPNGDGSNDGWKFVHQENIESLHIIILNRWGNLVFESDEVNFIWNGQIQNTGADCVDGTYFYKAELKDLKGESYEEHGFIHLIRDK